MSTKISIVNVNDYDSILDAIKAGITLIVDTLPFDIRECKSILLKPNLLRATKDACTQPIFGDLDNIEILGLSLEEARNVTPKFKVPGKFMTKFASFITRSIVYKVTKKIPILNKKLCIQCGQCSETCPVNAVNFISGEYPEFLRREYISCLCCMEMCRQEAIKPKLRGFGGLFHSY